MFQFYKISKVELWWTDWDYGQTWNSELQMWNCFLVPWKMSQYTSSGTLAAVKPNYVPGCIWKNMMAPSVGNKYETNNASSPNAQMLSLIVHDPAFEMPTTNVGTQTKGLQMNATFIPTYTSKGLDQTEWKVALARAVRQSGASPLPQVVYQMFMVKATYLFKGLRCIMSSALDDYLPTDEQLARQRAVNYYDGSDNMGLHPQKRDANNDVDDILCEDIDSDESTSGPPRKTCRRD